MTLHASMLRAPSAFFLKSRSHLKKIICESGFFHLKTLTSMILYEIMTGL